MNKVIGYRLIMLGVILNVGLGLVFGEVTPTPVVTPTQTLSVVVTTCEATDVTSNSATLNGTVNFKIPASIISRVIFQYGTTSGVYINSVDVASEAGKKTKNITGLLPHTIYYYRLVAIDKVNTYYGDEISFMTLSESETPVPVITPTSGCEIISISILPKRLILKKHERREVTVIKKSAPLPINSILSFKIKLFIIYPLLSYATFDIILL